MEELRLCESDYRFMCVVWDNAPLRSHELVELCAKGIRELNAIQREIVGDVL